ncbi:hypothetical protein KW805_03595 [Candidatus Pacearchaeota archaeon]|nr:hypothetical protein [Candidatus Pacearchaeota archaeon]
MSRFTATTFPARPTLRDYLKRELSDFDLMLRPDTQNAHADSETLINVANMLDELGEYRLSKFFALSSLDVARKEMDLKYRPHDYSEEFSLIGGRRISISDVSNPATSFYLLQGLNLIHASDRGVEVQGSFSPLSEHRVFQAPDNSLMSLLLNQSYDTVQVTAKYYSPAVSEAALADLQKEKRVVDRII